MLKKYMTKIKTQTFMIYEREQTCADNIKFFLLVIGHCNIFIRKSYFTVCFDKCTNYTCNL